MNRQEIDIELIKKCKEGCQCAYYELFNCYYKQVFTYIHSIVKSDEAEDLTMVTLEKAFKDLSKYTPFFTFRTWLMKIAKNTAIDHVRSIRFSYVDATNLHYITGNIENPEQQLIRKQTEEKIAVIIGEMPFVYQRVIEYRDNEYLCRSIASRFGISINTVVGQLARAKKYLIKKLSA